VLWGVSVMLDNVILKKIKLTQLNIKIIKIKSTQLKKQLHVLCKTWHERKE